MIPLRVALICPFDLDRLSGTPIRALATAKALEPVVDLKVFATGGSLSAVDRIDGVWQKRPGRNELLRADRFTASVARRLLRFRPDVIHGVSSVAVAPALVCKVLRPRTKFVFEVHGFIRHEMRGARLSARALLGGLDRCALLAANDLVAMSHTQRESMLAMLRRPGQLIHVLWGPVDIRDYPASELPRRSGFVVGYLGGGSFWQGIGTILEAARILDAQGSDVAFRLAGFESGPYEDRATPNVGFEGLPSRLQGIRFLQDCDVLLSTRLSGEVTALQYPHKLSHYLAAGRPVIASDVSDQRIILEKAQCGVTFFSGDAKSLTRAIQELADYPRAELTAMGRRARNFAEEHLSLHSLAKGLLGIYHGKGTPSLSGND